MTTNWDQWRRDQRGKVAELPKCSKCGATSVLDPCRSCSSTDELALLPPAPTGSR